MKSHKIYLKSSAVGQTDELINSELNRKDQRFLVKELKIKEAARIALRRKYKPITTV